MAAGRKHNNQKLHIGLVGCGNMGGAILESWLTAFPHAQFTILHRSKSVPANLKKNKKCSWQTRPTDTLATCDMVMLAVKPQDMEAACAAIKKFISSKTPVLSIAAGLSAAKIAGWLHKGQPVIRAMPNLPARIGQGISPLYAGRSVPPAHKNLAEKLMRVTGDVFWVKSESRIHDIAALTASGPAYVFHVIEVLTEAGVQMGIPALQAAELSRKTVTGSAALAAHSTLSARELREGVTSRKGMTAEALKILMDGGLQTIYTRALKAAAARSRVMGK